MSQCIDTIVVFEDGGFQDLYPLTYWRPTWDLRVGYRSLSESMLPDEAIGSVHYSCREMLAEVVAERSGRPVNAAPASERVLFLNGRLLSADPIPVDAMRDAPVPSAQWWGRDLAIVLADRALAEQLTPEVLLDWKRVADLLADVPSVGFVDEPRLVRYPWDLVGANPMMLWAGWRRAGAPALIEGRLCEGAHLLNRAAIHVGAGSTIKPGVVLDAENGPIHIGRHVTVCPNVSIEGPCFIGDGSYIQPGAVLRGGMSIGRMSKVGGELEYSIIHGFSNKQHDGFLGHAYVAEWVNLAADTVNSDLKNTYGTVRVPINGVEVESGQMFVGLTIGDHAKTGIGQMFATGSVVGFGSNVASCTFAPKFVPSFTWVTDSRMARYDLECCLKVARRVMARRGVSLTEAEERLFRRLPPLVEAVEHDGLSSLDLAAAHG